MENNSQQLGFQWKGGPKKRSKVEAISGFRDDNDDNDHRSQSDNGVKRQKQLVIPLLQTSQQTTKPNEDNENLTIDERAAQEVLKSLKPSNSSSGSSNSSLVINQTDNSNAIIGKKQQPLLQANLPPELLGINDDTERFKVDVALRPEDIGVKSAAYKQIPIEDFGAAMLRGMGWSGLTDQDEEISKKLMEPLFSRDVHLGLGAKAKPLQLDDKNKFRNNATKLEQSKSEWLIKAENKLNNQKLIEGDIVWLRVPEYAGLRGYIIKTQGVPGLNKVSIGLESSGKEVHIKRSDAVVLTKEELETKPFTYPEISIDDQVNTKPPDVQYFGLSHSKTKEETKSVDVIVTKTSTTSSTLSNTVNSSKGSNSNKIINRNNDSVNQKDHYDTDDQSNSHTTKNSNNSQKSSYLEKYGSVSSSNQGKSKAIHDKYGSSTSSSSSSQMSMSKCWLRTGLRVKLISNKYPKYYLKKGCIMDVYGENLASIRFDQNREILENIRQKHLETIVPSKHEYCIILNGKYRGMEAKVIERNLPSKNTNNNDNVLIQLSDELNIVQELSMDDICAFETDIYHQ